MVCYEASNGIEMTMKIISNLLVLLLVFYPSYGWSKPTRACYKDKITIDILLSDPNLPVPEFFRVSANEISKCKEHEGRCILGGSYIGQVFLKTKGGEIPKRVEIDISKLENCPFLIQIEAEGSSEGYFNFHFANAFPLLDGRSYSVYGEDVKLVVKRARQPF